MKVLFGMLGKCKVLSNHMVFIKSSQVILFPYIIGRFQKKCWFLNSRIAGRGSTFSIRPACRTGVSDRTCRTTGRVGQDVSDRTLFHMG